LNGRYFSTAKQPTKPLLRWDIYKAASKAKLIGTVEADADEAVQKAAEQFKQPATKLIAVRYG